MGEAVLLRGRGRGSGGVCPQRSSDILRPSAGRDGQGCAHRPTLALASFASSHVSSFLWQSEKQAGVQRPAVVGPVGHFPRLTPRARAPACGRSQLARGRAGLHPGGLDPRAVCCDAAGASGGRCLVPLSGPPATAHPAGCHWRCLAVPSLLIWGLVRRSRGFWAAQAPACPGGHSSCALREPDSEGDRARPLSVLGLLRPLRPSAECFTHVFPPSGNQSSVRMFQEIVLAFPLDLGSVCGR